jgi:hypothetical protein
MLVSTGPDIYFLAYRDPSVCTQLIQTYKQAYVKTKDTNSCWVGFVCKQP